MMIIQTYYEDIFVIELFYLVCINSIYLQLRPIAIMKLIFCNDEKKLIIINVIVTHFDEILFYGIPTGLFRQ